MRVFHIHEGFNELAELPAALPAAGYLWVTSGRREFEVEQAQVQALLQRLTGGQLVDLHISDLLNSQLPSHFDYTSWYDLMIFRRLAAGSGTASMFLDDQRGTVSSAMAALQAIDTSPVGFALFDRVLLTVHPADCQVREFFINRMVQMAQGQGAQVAQGPGSGAGAGSGTTTSRLPPNPADLMLRIVNHMVDGYLELRRLLTRQLAALQQELLNPRRRHVNWNALLESRNTLHQLEDICEDQRSAIQEWIDAMAEWPAAPDETGRRERELLEVRSRDVLEHIERVLSHVRRLESSAEGAVQMHFSAQGQRTNDIMRTLTVLTAIFLPLNLITGVFGMNFDQLPLTHTPRGFWIAFGIMVSVGVGLGLFFWRKRYLGTHH
jgi:magnesium transporter